LYENLENQKLNGKFFHVDAMYAQRDSGDTIPVILNLGTREGCVSDYNTLGLFSL
jgi:hypothetical protein